MTSSYLKYITIAIILNCAIVKSQIVFPDDDYSDNNAGLSDRYGRVDFYGRPIRNQYHFGFDRHFNRRPQNNFQQQQRPFYPQNLQQQQSQQVMSTSVAPQVQACIDSCVESTPGQYNPVCGTDNRTYHNRERFDCTVNCGQNISILRSGTCPRPTIPAWQRNPNQF